MICVYKITSTKGGIYIGQTINYKKRHSQYLRLKCKDQRLIYDSLLKHGIHNHKFEILQTLDVNDFENINDIKDKLNLLESYYVTFFNSFVGNNPDFGLNLTTGGGGCEMSKETKLKISDSIKKLMSNENIRNSISKKLKGREFSNETKQRIKESLKGKFVGEKHRLFGKKMPKETIEKMLKTRRDNYKKENNPITGRKYSDEHRKNISLAKLGKPSKVKGRKLSEEHKSKIGLANKRKSLMKKGIISSL